MWQQGHKPETFHDSVTVTSANISTAHSRNIFVWWWSQVCTLAVLLWAQVQSCVQSYLGPVHYMYLFF